jgi:hypothetical protein
MDHSAHGTGLGPNAGMSHGTATGGATDHSAHGGAAAVDHAAMGHGTSRTADAHAGHTARTNVHAGHGAATAPAASAHAGHSTPSGAADPHAQHGAAATTLPAVAPGPRSNADMRRVQPAATLTGDAFDAPAAVSISEAAKAAQGGGAHAGHGGMRGITPGEDRENPPTPMPATRDGSSPPPAADHTRHGAAPAQPAAAYSCPMHPEVTSDEPGTCPKCGMALVKKNG